MKKKPEYDTEEIHRVIKLCVEAMIDSSERMEKKYRGLGNARQDVMNYCAAHVMEIAVHTLAEVLARVSLSDSDPPLFVINAFGLINSKLAMGLSKVIAEYDGDEPKENDTPPMPPLH